MSFLTTFCTNEDLMDQDISKASNTKSNYLKYNNIDYSNSSSTSNQFGLSLPPINNLLHNIQHSSNNIDNKITYINSNINNSTNTLCDRKPLYKSHSFDNEMLKYNSINHYHNKSNTIMEYNESFDLEKQDEMIKETHKLAERQRRKQMKELFEGLRQVLPKNKLNKASKWEILSQAIDYIDHLKSANLQLSLELRNAGAKFR